MHKQALITTILVIFGYIILSFSKFHLVADFFIVLYLLFLTFFIVKKLTDKEEALQEKIENLNQATSELKAANEELHALNQQLLKSKKELETYKSYSENLILNMNHEIRTPLNSIIGFTKLMVEDFESLTRDDIKSSIEMIDESAKRLKSIIDNLIQLSKKPVFEIVDKDICDKPKYLFESIVSTIKGLIKNNDKIIFDYNIPENIPNVSFKESVLNSILLNIALASVVNTEKGSIELNMYESEEYFIVEFKDTGKQIDIEKVKNYFVKTDVELNTNEPEYRLFVAKQLAVKNDVDFQIESNEYSNKYIIKLKKC
ncbi:HAMP domain-containing sensor histidine kinase [Deferribacter thermophilus]|uniref:sensor histidine kinase n=1 Tax=Deferribacter thermophilus TaxID=53573 RepID=UPI003C2857AF